MPAKANQEIEIKLAVPSARAARALLQRHGWSPAGKRAFEANEVFDTPDRRLLGARCLLRLREYAGESILTFKGAPQPGPHKRREEIETTLSSSAALAAVFGKLGLESVFRYEKYRTVFGRPGERGHILLDETPMGAFLELEGPARWIDRTAAALGFAAADYITESYGGLYLDYRSRHPEAPADMVFTPRR